MPRRSSSHLDWTNEAGHVGLRLSLPESDSERSDENTDYVNGAASNEESTLNERVNSAERGSSEYYGLISSSESNHQLTSNY